MQGARPEQYTVRVGIGRPLGANRLHLLPNLVTVCQVQDGSSVKLEAGKHFSTIYFQFRTSFTNIRENDFGFNSSIVQAKRLLRRRKFSILYFKWKSDERQTPELRLMQHEKGVCESSDCCESCGHFLFSFDETFGLMMHATVNTAVRTLMSVDTKTTSMTGKV